MEIVEQTELSADQKTRITKIWNDVYPLSLVFSKASEFDEYLHTVTRKRHFLLLDRTGEIFGWTMTFDRENARWFTIILDKKIQGRGYGAKLIDKIKETESRLFGWIIDHNDGRKLNGEPYISPLGFYKKNGFEVCVDVRIETEEMSGVRIEWDDGGTGRRGDKETGSRGGRGE